MKSAVFVSYARTDGERVSRIAGGLEETGHRVWWDRRLLAHQVFAQEIEEALRDADCAVVAWSKTARDSLWVRAEAAEAWESGKLVQLSLDGVRPPLPFTVIHLLDFSHWSGGLQEERWVELERAVQAVLKAESVASPGPSESPLSISGLTPLVATGGASIALVLVAAGMVGLGATGAFSADAFGLVSSSLLLAGLLTFAHMLTRVIRVAVASR